MDVDLTDFLKSAEQSGIIPPDFTASWAQKHPGSSDAETLAAELVAAGGLTSFQANAVCTGQARHLVLGPYVILELIGKGGMGVVYKAEHRIMRRLVALKVIAEAATKNQEAVQRFRREVHVAARLEHPNIVTAHDAGEADGTHYLVMQFVDGRTLADVVKASGPQHPARAVDWILQTARGLAYAHEKGVIHRDIKPGNLLLDREGSVKILDMGLARLESLEPNEDQLTSTGHVMGTVDFMAPEQALDTRAADARSDIYSLGVTLWYLLAGRPMFSGSSFIKKILDHQQKPPPPLFEATQDIDPRLDRVFRRMVEKQAQDRYQSMSEVIAAISEISTAAAPTMLAANATPAPESRYPVPPDRHHATDPNEITVDVAPGSLPPGSRSRQPAATWRMAAALGGIATLVGVGLLLVADRHRGTATPATTPPLEPAAVTHTRRPPPPAAGIFDTAEARQHQEAWAKHLEILVETRNALGQTLVLIPPGSFTIGSGEQATTVTLTGPFLLGQSEVTQSQWRAVMETEPWTGKTATMDADDVPVTHVSWDDAQLFCKRLTEREQTEGSIGQDQAYRLPTEAEWEFACRAGTNTRFSFGDNDAVLGDHAWFGGGWNADGPVPGGNTATETHAHPVKLKIPNPWGLFDTHGNVWEWVADWQGEYQLGEVELKDPQGPPTGAFRGYRGGSFTTPPPYCRTSHRGGYVPAYRSYDVGFRVAMTPVHAKR